MANRLPLPNPFLAPRKTRPLVVGHRGAPKVFQENTMAGFRAAHAMGCPAIEMDVRLTKDGQAVVVHDSNLERLTGMQAEVGDLTWDQLAKLRVRRELPMGIDTQGAPVIVKYAQPERIPLFEEVLAELGHKIAMNVELKLDVPRWAKWWPTDVGNVVAELLAKWRLEDRVIVTSFDPRKLLAAMKRGAQLAVGFCWDDTMLSLLAPLLSRLRLVDDVVGLCNMDRRPGHHARRALSRLLERNVVGRIVPSRLVGAEHTLIGTHTVERLHARDIAIGTHTLFPMGSTTGKPLSPTASSEREVERLVELGVDWIETDDPERLLEVIG